MSRSTTLAFADVIEWAASQEWTTGKVGLLGISYYAGSQWRVAAHRPKGLAAIIPTDGMADYYRDRCRHGGILTGFLKIWWDRQVLSNQYGLAGKVARNWGPDTAEGDLSPEELAANRRDQVVDNAKNFYRDDAYYASREYNLEDIVVPLLSFGNPGSIMIHWRGNYEGFRLASSEKKFLRLSTGRHDLPFYEQEQVELQRSFLDAFLKGQDRDGWTDGSRPPVDLILRKGDVGFNNPAAEKVFQRRFENEWPLARTQYTKWFLTPERTLTTSPSIVHHARLTYPALGNIRDQKFIRFETAPLEDETEITGYIVAHLNVSVSASVHDISPSDIELFLTLRHLTAERKEVHYTGITGEPVPLSKGWLRVSHRKVNKDHPRHRDWLPYRDHFARDVLPVLPGEVYPVDVEVWATTVIASKGDRLVLEVASGDTEGSGLFGHDTPERLVYPMHRTFCRLVIKK